MAKTDDAIAHTSFLGIGWSFPPAFVRGSEGGRVEMVSDETDINQSLRILFGTAVGERYFVPDYGLDARQLLFEPLSTTLRTLLEERIKIAILVYEPRINIIALTVNSPDPNSGQLLIDLEYEIRGTNSRYNLVYPFYDSDSSEVRPTSSKQRTKENQST